MADPGNNMKITTLLYNALLGGAFIVLANCSTRMQLAPPAPLVEIIPVSPSPTYVWVTGHHRYQNRNYVWVPGRYQTIPHGKNNYIQGRYVVKHGHNRYVKGHWK